MGGVVAHGEKSWVRKGSFFIVCLLLKDWKMTTYFYAGSMDKRGKTGIAGERRQLAEHWWVSRRKWRLTHRWRSWLHRGAQSVLMRQGSKEYENLCGWSGHGILGEVYWLLLLFSPWWNRKQDYRPKEWTVNPFPALLLRDSKLNFQPALPVLNKLCKQNKHFVCSHLTAVSSPVSFFFHFAVIFSSVFFNYTNCLKPL